MSAVGSERSQYARQYSKSITVPRQQLKKGSGEVTKFDSIVTNSQLDVVLLGHGRAAWKS